MTGMAARSFSEGCKVFTLAGIGMFALGAFSLGAAELEPAPLPIRGIVRAVGQASISSDLIAVVDKVGFRLGEAFKKGDLLLAFDCRKYRAQLAAAEAQRREMTVSLDSSTFLQTKGAGSKQDREIAQARTDKASAEADELRAVIDHCEIAAPFNGRIGDLQVHEHEMPVQGRPLLTILSTEKLEIELILPSVWLRWLTAGAPFNFVIDETGKTYRGRVVRLGAAVDAISQTIRVTAEFLEPEPAILPGMSGAAVFSGHEG